MKVALVAPPWPLFNRPSIQLGALKAYLAREVPEVEVRAHHPYLACARRLGFEAYDRVSRSGWASEAVAAAVLFPGRAGRCEALFRRSLRRHGGGRRPDFAGVRAAFTEAMSDFLDGVDWRRIRLAGFSVCLNQLTAALYLAREVRRRSPGTAVVLGGSACAGELGAGLLRAFPFVDFVVNGEGERPLAGLVRHLRGDGGLPPGVVHRAGSGAAPSGRDQVPDLDALPPPDYRDYFEELGRLPAGDRFVPVLPVEFSRGCWWGRCRFCNLNLQWSGYRAKSVERMAAEVRALSRGYGVLDFAFTDNALPRRQAAGFFRAAAGLGDLAFFAELRAVHGRAEWAEMARGGLRDVQVGIEALSTSLLRRLGKGATAMDNVAAMRHAAEAGVRLGGNLILHFPGSTPEEVAETLAVLDFVWPFEPLKPVSFWLGHESPVAREPAAYGLRAVRPHPAWAGLFPPEVLRGLPVMVLGYRGDRGRQRRLWRPVETRLRQWAARRAGAGPALTCRDGGDFLLVRQVLPDGRTLHHRLRGASRRLYLACLEPRPLAELGPLAGGRPAAEIAAFVADLVAKRIMFREGDRVLSLAVRARGANHDRRYG
ncbi:RiPP maturation radical SAM protein 1 [Dissulfurirhabdus thermomarina]|uniref:RiPP maturation radical SAM protein 1 n=1 Tax=Dissulfurirhabdus thermomarina TaxID=1765737 RepID=A0A6N9TQB4_DISTH|nr:RiPP maturation radical SAM C-methyltransferase [Dissulfurirhabdus thermomarina]NDY42640.1 RiPP maturation radical SAM protein 1 [Dissulfurirhabdus thermomarina]NMX22686.1 RiPP maturation radical SAM protein 1 [Dissulfurirhabdus thermomarina]